jgi:hypothetical protein
MAQTLAALALIAGAPLGGCGGTSGAAKPSGQATTPRTYPRTPERSSGASKRPNTSERLAHLPPTARTNALRRAVYTIVGFMGFPRPHVFVAAGGHSVAVALAQGEVCAAKPGSDALIVERVESTLPAIHSVTITVAPGGQPFASYRRAGCAPPTLPGGSGAVVYSRTGSGRVETPAFKISGRRWTVAYRNDGGLFLVFLFKDDKLQQSIISSSRKGPGKQTFAGPGRFKLRIVGSYTWAVTVRGGA